MKCLAQRKKIVSNFSDADVRKAIVTIKQRKLDEEKRKFYEAKRTRGTSSSPMAEAADLKSAQCQFESDLEDKVDRIVP